MDHSIPARKPDLDIQIDLRIPSRRLHLMLINKKKRIYNRVKIKGKKKDKK